MRWQLLAVSRLRTYSMLETVDTDDPACCLDSQIQDDPIHADPSRILFVASSTSDTLSIIKFARRYCAELHALCAKLGRALQLLAFERLPIGWCGVAMEYILAAVPLRSIPKDHVKRLRWRKELQEVLTQFRRKNLVHGDLSDTNIVVEKDERVMLVDFDLGGNDGETVYPQWDLNKMGGLIMISRSRRRTMKEFWRMHFQSLHRDYFSYSPRLEDAGVPGCLAVISTLFR
jgi:RIO1 family